jgi:hypothetical protein
MVDFPTGKRQRATLALAKTMTTSSQVFAATVTRDYVPVVANTTAGDPRLLLLGSHYQQQDSAGTAIGGAPHNETAARSVEEASSARCIVLAAGRGHGASHGVRLYRVGSAFICGTFDLKEDRIRQSSISTAARQFAAALRSLRQTRPVPSTAEGLYQQHCACHPTPQDIDRRDFIRKCSTLGGNDLEVTCNSALVPSGGKV